MLAAAGGGRTHTVCGFPQPAAAPFCRPVPQCQAPPSQALCSIGRAQAGLRAQGINPRRRGLEYGRAAEQRRCGGAAQNPGARGTENCDNQAPPQVQRWRGLIETQFAGQNRRANLNIPEDFLINQISGSFVELVLWSCGLDKADTGGDGPLFPGGVRAGFVTGD